MATPEDDRIEERNHEKEKEAYKICLEKIEKHGLAMKLVQAEYTFDNNKLLFYFTADGRIDFRELVKDLASVFRTPDRECPQLPARLPDERPLSGKSYGASAGAYGETGRRAGGATANRRISSLS